MKSVKSDENAAYLKQKCATFFLKTKVENLHHFWKIAEQFVEIIGIESERFCHFVISRCKTT